MPRFAAGARIAGDLDADANSLGVWILLSGVVIEHIAASAEVLRDRLVRTGLAQADATRLAIMAASWAFGLVVTSRCAALGRPGPDTRLDALARGGARLLLEGWRASSADSSR